jgi:hypothetical protein
MGLWQGGHLDSSKEGKGLFLSLFILKRYKIGYEIMLKQRITSPLTD